MEHLGKNKIAHPAWRIIMLVLILAISTALYFKNRHNSAPASTMIVNTAKARNVFGEQLQPCCFDPMTGYFRDGFCRTASHDFGTHVVCAEMTASFLAFTKSRGNDLSNPRPEYHFPGLQPGDRWCLCALRWKEAEEAGKAPPVILASTDERALKYIPLETLKKYALEPIE